MPAVTGRQCDTAASESDPYWSLFCSARQAIQDAAETTAGEVHATTTGDRDDEVAPRRHNLEQHLQRLVDEACHSRRTDHHGNATGADTNQTQQGRFSGVKRPREEASREGEKVASERNGGDAVEAQDDACLGLVAEAFADELDLLRKDEHFGGSARDVAGMADMMRCLTGGLDSTEKRLLLRGTQQK